MSDKPGDQPTTLLATSSSVDQATVAEATAEAKAETNAHSEVAASDSSPVMIIVGAVSAVVVAAILAFLFVYTRNTRRSRLKRDIEEQHVTRAQPFVDHSKKPTKATPAPQASSTSKP